MGTALRGSVSARDIDWTRLTCCSCAVNCLAGSVVTCTWFDQSRVCIRSHQPRFILLDSHNLSWTARRLHVYNADIAVKSIGVCPSSLCPSRRIESKALLLAALLFHSAPNYWYLKQRSRILLNKTGVLKLYEFLTMVLLIKERVQDRALVTDMWSIWPCNLWCVTPATGRLPARSILKNCT